MSESNESYRPYVQIAAFCRTTIQDITGSLSLIQLIDRLPVNGITDEMQPTPITGLTLVVVLKAGFMRGRSTLKITPMTPSGTEMPSAESSILFEGEERGVAGVFPMAFIATEEGLYWFDVYVNGDRLTRIPLRILYQKVPQPR